MPTSRSVPVRRARHDLLGEHDCAGIRPMIIIVIQRNAVHLHNAPIGHMGISEHRFRQLALQILAGSNNASRTFSMSAPLFLYPPRRSWSA